MLALGLNSDSSFDGIDAVLVDIGADGLLKRRVSSPGKPSIGRKRVADQALAAFENKLSIFELCRLNYVPGALYEEAARSLRRETETPPEALAVILDEITTMIAAGGGVRNKALMERIRANLPPDLRLAVSDEFGHPAQYKEAVKFAALALAAQLQLANNIPAASGASRFAILGKLVLAPWLARGVGSVVQQRERA
jgi:1,6-anhydro-N-acetylmuramate kinase